MGWSHFQLIHSFFLFTLGQADFTRYKGEIPIAGGVLYFANFAPFLNHKLNHSEIMDIRTVVDEEECIAACTENSECRSVNLKTTAHGESADHICELLNTDKFASYEEFVENLDFNHYSFTVGLFQKLVNIIIYKVFLPLDAKAAIKFSFRNLLQTYDWEKGKSSSKERNGLIGKEIIPYFTKTDQELPLLMRAFN